MHDEWKFILNKNKQFHFLERTTDQKLQLASEFHGMALKAFGLSLLGLTGPLARL